MQHMWQKAIVAPLLNQRLSNEEALVACVIYIGLYRGYIVLCEIGIKDTVFEQLCESD